MQEKEFTLKSIILGLLFAIIFSVFNAYLALKVGIIASISIPAAVLAIASFRIIKRGTMLETNIVQTIASSSESVAIGLIFVIPCFFMWGIDLSLTAIILLGILGGVLGVIFLLLIPIKKSFDEDEKELVFPEAVACADLIKENEEGGKFAKLLFAGLGIGAIFKILSKGGIFGLWKKEASLNIPATNYSLFNIELSPEFLGIGYLIGPRISSYLFGGGLLAWLIFIPLIQLFGMHVDSPIFPELRNTIDQMSEIDIWSSYIRYIGVGAIVTAGLIFLVKTIFKSIGVYRDKLINIRNLKFIPAIAVVLLVLFAILPKSIAPIGVFEGLFILAFSLFFILVSIRATGLVGMRQNPITAFTIIALILGTLLFTIFSFEISKETLFSILATGTVICLVTSVSSDLAHDFKTGHILGASVWHQTFAKLLGVIVSAIVIGIVIILLNKTHGFGDGGELLAPQASLIKLIIDGIGNYQFCWKFLLIGVFVSVISELLGLSSLAIAIGIYLPISITAPIMLGGLISWIFSKKLHTKDEEQRNNRKTGARMFSSGLLAGGILASVVVGILAFSDDALKKPVQVNKTNLAKTIVTPYKFTDAIVLEDLAHGRFLKLFSGTAFLHDEFGLVHIIDDSFFGLPKKGNFKFNDFRNGRFLPGGRIALKEGGSINVLENFVVDLESGCLVELAVDEKILIYRGAELEVLSDIPILKEDGQTETLSTGTKMLLQGGSLIFYDDGYRMMIPVYSKVIVKKGAEIEIAGKIETSEEDLEARILDNQEFNVQNDSSLYFYKEGKDQAIKISDLPEYELRDYKLLELCDNSNLKFIKDTDVVLGNNTPATIMAGASGKIIDGDKVLRGGFLRYMSSPISLGDFGSILMFLILSSLIFYFVLKE